MGTVLSRELQIPEQQEVPIWTFQGELEPLTLVAFPMKGSDHFLRS